MPQMSPMYWMFISLFCYINFIMMMSLINTILLKVSMSKLSVCKNIWKWLW